MAEHRSAWFPWGFGADLQIWEINTCSGRSWHSTRRLLSPLPPFDFTPQPLSPYPWADVKVKSGSGAAGPSGSGGCSGLQGRSSSQPSWGRRGSPAAVKAGQICGFGSQTGSVWCRSWVAGSRLPAPAQRQAGTAAGTPGAGSDPLPNAAKPVASPALVGNEDCCLVLLCFLAAVWSCWFLSGAQRCWHFFLFVRAAVAAWEGGSAFLADVPRITLN